MDISQYEDLPTDITIYVFVYKKIITFKIFKI